MPATALLDEIRRLTAKTVISHSTTARARELEAAAQAEIDLQLALTKALEANIPMYKLSEIAGKARVARAWCRMSGQDSGTFRGAFQAQLDGPEKGPHE